MTGNRASLPLTLSRGDTTVEIDPALGGSLRSMTVNGIAVLRPAPASNDQILSAACFPLVPFANRIAYGRFTVDGRQIALPADPVSPPHALHGQGWRNAWTVDFAEDDGALLSFEHAPDAWPWRYRATQRIALIDRGMEITLELENRDARPMPAGLGLHPYFARRSGCRLILGATALLGSDKTGIPTTPASFVPGTHPIKSLAGIDNMLLDGGDHATIEDDDGTITLVSRGIAGFHLYVPAQETFFCLEPVSHRPDSVNSGVPDMLESTEIRSLSLRIEYRTRE